MSSRARVPGDTGRLKEYAKLGLRGVLHRRNLDLVRDPYPARVARALHALGADTVLDVGANIGQYASALRASGYTGRIVSFEPLPDAYAVLARRSASDPAWTSVHTAVGAEAGTLDIHVAANSYSSSILPMTHAHLDAAPGSQTIATVAVPVTTVREAVAAQAVQPGRTLLKIDTQGYESRVLDGAGELVAQFALVQLELSFVALYDGQDLAEPLLARLAAAGFDIYALDAGFADPHTGRMLQCDGLFARRDLLEALR